MNRSASLTVCPCAMECVGRTRASCLDTQRFISNPMVSSVPATLRFQFSVASVRAMRLTAVRYLLRLSQIPLLSFGISVADSARFVL